MTQRLVVKCLEPHQCSVVFEPYGAEYILAADDQLNLEIDVSDDSSLEVAYSPGCITIWLPGAISGLRATNRMGDSIDLGVPL